MASRFEERLASGPVVVGDGGMGALITSAVGRLRCPEEANIRAPEAVVSLHVSFINAGADLIETNTFGANRPKLAGHYLEDEFERINSQGVRLAREAREVAGREVFVAGSIGPLGDLEDVTGTQRRELVAEQARILEGRGADLFLVETFFDLDELITAIEAVKAVSSLPVVAMLSFDEDAQTAAGVPARDAAKRLAGLGLAAIGANHGAGPLAGLAALEAMGRELPLAVMPNIGLASLAGGRVVYPHATPDYFAEFAAHARDLGARLIGGCCGTTPAEIAAIRAALEEHRQVRSPLVLSEPALDVTPAEAHAETDLARRLREGEFVVSVQIDPPLGGRNDGLLETARELQASGVVDVLDINDNPMARARMSALMSAVAIEGAVGIETIPHQTPRDTTLMGLESVLLGAHAAGVRNVLAVTGDPPAVGDYPGSHGVYEVDSIGLVHLIARLNQGEDYNGKAIDAPTSFHVGVAVNPSADDMELELERFHRKVEQGAAFAMTQILFDLGYLERFLAALGGTSPVPLLVGLWPLRSHQLALRLHNEVPGIVVPEPVQRALEEAGPRAPETGLALTRELLAGARDLAAGAYVVSSFRQPLAVLDLLGVIETERLVLRGWRDADLEPFAALNADPETMRWFPAPLTREESDAFAGRARARLDETGWGLWAVEVAGGAPFIGFVGLAIPRFEAHFTPTVEIGWRLAREHWGKGYATEAARAVLADGFDRLGLDEILSWTAVGNVPSRRVMERIGMTHDPAEDFEHPLLPVGHPLRPHVLYRSPR